MLSNKFHRIPLVLWLLAAALKVTAQSGSLSLDSCYLLARTNYPLTKSMELIKQSGQYSVDNIARGFWPQVQIMGQASYQSEVTQLPIKIPGMNIPTLSQDQHKLYADVNQTLYDGGVNKQQQALQKSNTAAELQKTETELYKLKERINQFYFGILLVDAQLKQTDILKADLNNMLERVNAGIKGGIALNSQAELIQAEMLKLEQRTIELNSGRTAYINMLGLFINRNLPPNTTLVTPVSLNSSTTISRPELQIFDLQNQLLVNQQNLLTAKNRPKLSVFVQAGFGRPALNMLNNDFKSYYIGGLRLNMPISGFYTLKNEKAIIQLNYDLIEAQRAGFLFNTNLQLKQQEAEVEKIQKLLNTDDALINLRISIRKTAAIQLENGVLQTTDYLHELNAEDQARQNKALHQIQLLMTAYSIANTAGH
jgi:outer membrane protein TolC